MWPLDKKHETSQQLKKCRHHYVLVHVALRQICQEIPFKFFDVMVSPQRDDFLGDIWRQVRENCDPEGAPLFDITDVGITTCRIKDFPCIVVTMPTPANAPEAYFVGIVLKVNTNAEKRPERPEIAYLTLEKEMNLDETERTVLCEWTGQDCHMNYGDGPPATRAEFMKAIEKMI